MKQIAPVFFTSLGLVLMAAALVACDGEVCQTSNDLEEADQAGLRNPVTGVCEFFGTPGGGGSCEGDFGGASADEAPQAQPDQALCFGCEGNSEMTCIATDSCRPIYERDGSYSDCWGTAPSGPAPGLECEGLDAYQCSRTDHCEAAYDRAGFVICADEKTICTGDSECSGTDVCSAATECLPGPGCEDGLACDAACYGFCLESNTDPGSCIGDVACDQPQPDCPAGTIAGRTADCWTGFCIPVESCDAAPACSQLTENECTASGECTGLYRGEGCTCEGSGCSCTSYVYEGCGDA